MLVAVLTQARFSRQDDNRLAYFQRSENRPHPRMPNDQIGFGEAAGIFRGIQEGNVPHGWPIAFPIGRLGEYLNSRSLPRPCRDRIEQSRVG